MLEYVLAKILSDEKLKNSNFMILTKDIRRIKGKILSVSNGIVIIETETSGKILSEFVIIDKISAIELATSFVNGETELIKKRLEKYLDEFEDHDKGCDSVADLIECIGNSEKACIISKYHLDGNHSLCITVDEYGLITNEISIFYFFSQGAVQTEFNMLLLANDSINSIAIPELCERLEESVFKGFRYIKS
ncbi:MAG: hypothetical protein ACRCWG_13885 [Sarcina sp.]